MTLEKFHRIPDPPPVTTNGGGVEITCKKTTAISGHFWPLRQRADDLWRCGNGGSI